MTGAGILEDVNPAVLGRVSDPTVGLALWRRDRFPGVALDPWLDALPADRLPRGRFLVRLGDVDTVLVPLLDGAGAPVALAADIVDLSRRFLDVAGGDWVDLRLEVVEGDACWKFHRDHVRLRLIATYRGPGTQVVAPIDAACALARQRRYQGPLYEMPRHAVALFKGCGEACGEGVVHRSPPIAGTGQARLVLCLNQPSAASPEPWGLGGGEAVAIAERAAHVLAR
ncbi:DUF1826 domain-containing protein [Nitrospirillum sp. BR 11163]|uniref:DUF1826 domain-containing protein n=1 Tax=Nitrospirillum sp. BR 11163 TaxID=3104323 RepID=UPI002AFE7081|nr:DUF1826 domain-containing protein [Nitrospirillum sp. BR 11163]MEA1675519.1 DUF1826 domain-containing protein [Nitrospirillum sp. BR 11163]